MIEDKSHTVVASNKAFARRAVLFNDLAMVAVLTLMVTAAAIVVVYGLRQVEPPPIDTRLRSGKHLTFVLIGPTSLSNRRYTHEVQEAKAAMREHAVQRGYLFSTIGVSDAWRPQEALDILAAFGPFDEMIVGRNWFNTGVQKYIDERRAFASVPQVVITLQHIRVDTIPLVYGEVQELGRFIGPEEMEEWARRGFFVDTEGITAGSLRK